MDNEELKENINQEQVKEEIIKEEKPQVDPVQLIKNRFGQYQHSLVVLSRAVKSCRVSQINEYLNKCLEEEPKWENRWNIVYSILTKKELPTCKFCHKTLPFSYLLEGKVYCSEQCEKTAETLETSKKEQSSSINIFQKILSIFNIFKKRK